jgi:hypothetical protein
MTASPSAFQQRRDSLLFFVILIVLAASVWLGLSAGKTTATSQATTVATACQKVAYVLSDGPDPDADPVGYALAQIHPLARIKTSNAPLQAAITDLSNAYATFYQENGTTAADQAVVKAAKNIDAFCPGVTS